MTNTRILKYGTQTIEYELVLEPRKTLTISVNPDLSVTIKAPTDTDPTLIEERVSKRANWISKKIRQYELYLPDLPPRQYVSGESYRFLGKQYRLKVDNIYEDESEKVYINSQYLFVHTRDKSPLYIKLLVENWYLDQATKIFNERLHLCFPKFKRYDIVYPDIAIHKLKTSWGNCSPGKKITLNIKLIQVPKIYIDYVIIHEISHLVEHNHGPKFRQLLDRTMPDWKERKVKLDHFDFG
jgi:predicted metal-dependent hydrolase